MRNWDTREEYAADTGYEWKRDWEEVQLVCRAFGIPCQMIDLSKEYWNRMFEPALRDWEHGSALNPDVWCNREIKFGALLERLPYKDAWLATGHYARKDWAAGRPRRRQREGPVVKPLINNAEGPRALFPIGHLTKPAVRALAQNGGVPQSVFERPESMGLCFVGEKKRTREGRRRGSHVRGAAQGRRAGAGGGSGTANGVLAAGSSPR
ncbi:tRNA-specific 2-thiouridylase [Mycena latifolia]|nr:tRNA-specific 2-thiouridylase [Mycena latifolia]